MSTSNVVGMPGVAMAHPPNQPVPEVVEVLEEWLERAKSGDLIQIVIGGVTSGKTTSTDWVGCAAHYHVVHVATILQARIVQEALKIIVVD